jgi:hypothetical protein
MGEALRRAKMQLMGTVRQGVVVLDNGSTLPDGTRVEVVVKSTDDQPGTLREVLLRSAGCMSDLPADFAEQHDHYIHGTPKR